MKNLLILSLSLLLSLPMMAQKGPKFKRGSLKALNLKIQKSKASPEFKKLMDITLAADDDDCTPPPCTGIIDPWTCECYDDIVDPWEEDKAKATAQQAKRRYDSFNQAETLASSAMGGPITPEMVQKAQGLYPSRNYMGMLNRLKYYTSALR